MAPRQRTFTTPPTEDDSAESTTLLADQSKGIRRKAKLLNQTEADIARDWHDYFNLVALVSILKC